MILLRHYDLHRLFSSLWIYELRLYEIKIRTHCVHVSDIEQETHHDGGAVSSLRVLRIPML
jgi:hypothetical protein